MRFLRNWYLLAPFLPAVLSYTIQNCGASRLAIDYAVTIAKGTMISALQDLPRGVSSPHGYTAMYKSNIWLSGLHELMSNILYLNGIQVAGRDQKPNFICVNQHMESGLDNGIDALEYCKETKVTSFWVKDTTIIFLCPSFTDLPLQPAFSPHGPWDIYCPVVQHNMFPGVSDPLVKYQCYDLVYQLAHLYLESAGLTNETVPKEALDWNGCVALGSGSGRNAFNLVYYTACKLSFPPAGEGGNREVLFGAKPLADMEGWGGSRQSGMHADAGSVQPTVLARTARAWWDWLASYRELD